MITKKWVVCNGEGHWAIYVDGKHYANCDYNEDAQVIQEIMQLLQSNAA